jgi:hypothetical protein
LHTSIDSDQTTPSIDEDLMLHPVDLMSPTTLQAQLDHLSPVEDLDMDEMDVSLISDEDETPKTTTPVEETSGLAADKCGELKSSSFAAV